MAAVTRSGGSGKSDARRGGRRGGRGGGGTEELPSADGVRPQTCSPSVGRRGAVAPAGGGGGGARSVLGVPALSP